MKYFVSAVLAALVYGQTPACSICWDGSEAKLEDGACVCPNVNGEDTVAELPEVDDGSINCSKGNVDACNRAFGFFDFTDCTCTYPPAHANIND